MRKSRKSGQEPRTRALSARCQVWQSGGILPALCPLALILAAPAAGAPGGDIDTMPVGDYVCELPGDASGPAGRHVPAEDFTVVNSSSYRTNGSMGSYLLAGDQLAMTSGPLRGKRYHRLSDGFVRLIGADGQDSELRCVRRKRNNS